MARPALTDRDGGKRYHSTSICSTFSHRAEGPDAQAAELEGRAMAAVDAAMLTDASLMHPPGLIAIAALRQVRQLRRTPPLQCTGAVSDTVPAVELTPRPLRCAVHWR